MAPQRWIDELLARSKQISLKICLCLAFCYPLGESRPLMEKVADHAEHIEELRLHLCGNFNQGLDPFLRPCSRVPRLQVLDIQGYFSAWCGESLMEKPYPSRPTMAELSTLSSMHDLVNLRLCVALPSPPSFLAYADINLPRLSRLLIRAPLSTVVALLSYVNTPPRTEMKLYCNDEDNTTPHLYFRLSYLLARKFRSYKDQVPSVPTIRMLNSYPRAPILVDIWVSVLSHFQELHHLKVSASGISDLAYALSLAHHDNMESQAGYIGQGSRMLCAPGLEVL